MRKRPHFCNFCGCHLGFRIYRKGNRYYCSPAHQESDTDTETSEITLVNRGGVWGLSPRSVMRRH